MPKTTVPVQLGPLSQKSPKQAGVLASLATVQNMVALKGDADGLEFWPRPGVSAVSKTTDTGSITAGVRMSTLGTSLLMQDGANLWRRATDKWHLIGPLPTVGVTTTPVVSNTLLVESVCSVYCNGYVVTAYTSNAGFASAQVRVLVKDATGATVIDAGIASGSSGSISGVRIAVTGTLVIVTYQVPILTQLYAWKLDTSAIAFPLNTPVLVTSSCVGHSDCQAIGATGTLVLSYLNTSNTYHLVKLTASTMAVSGDTNTAIAGNSCFSLLVNDWATNVIYAGWGAIGTGITVAQYDGSTFAAGTSTVYDAATVSITSLAGIRIGSSVTVVATTTPSGTAVATAPTDYRVIKSTGPGTTTTLIRSVHLASRVVSANGTLYVLVQYVGHGQGTYFLVDLATGATVAKCLENLATQASIDDPLPSLTIGATASTLQTACLRNVAAATSATGLAAYVGASAVTFVFGDTTVGRGVELNGGCHFPGAMPHLYDGQAIVEEGFAVAPEQMTATQSTGGSLVPLATYTIRAVYAWTDAAGNLHRSDPTIVPQQFTMTGANTLLSLTVPMLRITSKTNVSIEIYASVSNGDGSALFNIVPFASPIINDPTVDSISYAFQLSDAAIAQGEPLYTDGNILDNISPPPCKAFAVHKGRLLAVGVDGDPEAVWFSKDVEPGFGVAWNDGLVSRLQATSDPISAAISMDAFAVVSTAGGTTWASSDEYPDDQGTGGVLRFQQYSSMVGCVGTSLLARTDDGVTIWAGSASSAANVPPKQIWLVSRGLAFDYRGVGIEQDATGFTPAAVVPVPGQNQIRIVGTDAGGVSAALVYEGVFKTWATWRYTQQATAIVDAILWAGVVAYLCADGTVLTENATGYDDLGVAASVAHLITLNSFQFGGIGGYQRMLGGNATGQVLGTGGFALRVDQTIDGAAQTRKTLTIATTDKELNAEWDPGNAGKCSDYQLTISDASNGANTAWTLAAVTLGVRTMEGLDRQPPSRRAT